MLWLVPSPVTWSWCNSPPHMVPRFGPTVLSASSPFLRCRTADFLQCRIWSRKHLLSATTPVLQKQTRKVFAFQSRFCPRAVVSRNLPPLTRPCNFDNKPKLHLDMVQPVGLGRSYRSGIVSKRLQVARETPPRSPLELH